jgi:hypothetical protein
MLHSHPRIAIPYESHFITEYAARAESYGDLNVRDNLERLVSDILAEDLLQKWDHEFDSRRIVESIGEPGVGAVIDAIYAQYCESKNKSRWGDKSDYLTKIDVINEIFPDAQFVHCVRDGRDVASSVIKLSWGPSDIVRAAEWWSMSVRLGRSMGRMLPKGRYTEVRYEDLVQDPQRTLRDLCDFLGEEYSDRMLEFHTEAASAIPDARKGQHQNVGSKLKKSRVAAWTREMSQVDIAIFDHYSSNELTAFGYPTGASSASKFAMEIKRAMIMVKRFVKALTAPQKVRDSLS